MTSSPGAGRFRPGPIYDSALRALLLADPLAWCGWSGEPIDAAVLAPVAGDLPAGTRFADSVARTGARRLVHVEFTRGGDAELPLRMSEYRARLLRRADLRQLSLVLLATVTVTLASAGIPAGSIERV